MAYNIRRNKTADHEPAAGAKRQLNHVREIGAYAFGIAVAWGVYWLARRYLF
jgi:hypothetical protein